MEFQKLRKKLMKLDNLLQTLEKSGEAPNAIERELLKSYLVDLYETAFSNNSSIPAAKTTIFTPDESEGEDSIKFTAKQTYTRRTVKEEDNPRTTERPATPVAEEIPYFETETKKVENQEKTESQVPPLEPEVVIPLAKDKTKTDGSREVVEELFHFEMGIEISDKLANLPLKSLKGAVGINDKLMIVNTLFQGDMAKYNDLIDRVDKMGDFTQVRLYLQEEIIPKFMWTEEERVDRARDFIKLINRRFLN
jgi:hypothetical protein